MAVKGNYFTIDAMIASAIIISAVLVTTSFYIEEKSNTDVNYLSHDLIVVLSNLKIGETSNSYVAELIAKGNITGSDLNNSILVQIGRFWALGQDELAENLSREVIISIMPSGYGYGVWMDQNQTYNITNSEVAMLFSYKRMISGIERDKPIEGFTSTIFLNSIENRLTSSFGYFGGFVGEGNISQRLLLPDNFTNISNIKEVNLDIDAGNDFQLFINDVFAGNFTVGSGGGGIMIPDQWILSSSYHSLFHNGTNNFTLSFQNLSSNYSSENPDAVGGGFLQVEYFFNESQEMGIDYDSDGNATTRYYLPGIEGVINLYDSFFVPGMLMNMSAYIHIRSNYSTFFNIGATNVFMTPGNSTDDIKAYLNHTHMESLFNISDLSKKTIPIRLGHPELASGFGNGEADVVLITDLSGSMGWELTAEVAGTQRDCNDSNLYDDDTERLSLAKCLDKTFISTILNNSGNRVALSGFYGDSGPPNKGRVYEETLTDDAAYLQGKVNAYSAQGGTCICCAINDAYKILFEESNPSRKKFIIVMSDGIPTHTCQASSGCEGTRTGLHGKEGLWLGSAGCYGGSDDCETGDCDCAITNANWSSCRAYNDLNATVYSIGFGPVDACIAANDTLRSIADCGQGEYYASDNASMLADIYQNISSTILALSYENQTTVTTGNLTTSFLYPDSYIELNYTPIIEPPVYGKIPITVQGNEFGNTYSNGTLYLPPSAELIEMKACSYSGDTWTSLVTIDNTALTEAYNLSEYGSSFKYLGDAFVVDVPVDTFIYSMNNTVTTRTGTIPVNYSDGSPANRLVYSVRIDRFINPGGIFTSVEGCNWTFEIEDGSIRDISIPPGYNGTSRCFYNSTTHTYLDSVNSTDDGLQYGAFQIFDLFDFDNDGLVSIDLTENNLNTTSYHQSGVPSMWGPAIAEVRVWK